MGNVNFHSGKKSVEIHGVEYAYAWVLVDRLSHAAANLGHTPLQDENGNGAINTIIVMGSPPIQFLACFAGLGDPWFWVKGEHRAWLADVIEDGLRIGIFRYGITGGKPTSFGWDELIVLLRENAELPVVTTYSPNVGPITSMIKEGDSEPITAFLSELEQHEDERWRRIGPDNIGYPRFKGNHHAFESNRRTESKSAVA